MLRHSLATLEVEQEFKDFYRALLSQEGSPLSLFNFVGNCKSQLPTIIEYVVSSLSFVQQKSTDKATAH